MTQEQIKEILKFYADAHHYEMSRRYVTTPQGFGWVAEESTVQKDAGKKARKILAKMAVNDSSEGLPR